MVNLNRLAAPAAALLLGACARAVRAPAPVPGPPGAAAFRVLSAEELPAFADDLSSATLEAAALRSSAYLESLDPSRSFQLGPFQATPGQLKDSVARLSALYKEASSPAELRRRLGEEFYVLESLGSDGRGSVLYTAYYEPTLKASLKKEGPFRFPLYRKPPDLVEVDLDLFSAKYQGERVWGRVQDGKLAPYLSREEIDYGGALSGLGLELAWLDNAWDALTVHIEGSSLLELTDGRVLRARFAASNGLPFKSPAMALVELGFFKREQLSASRVRAFLLEHPELERKVLTRDPRYAFFELEEARPGEGPLGTIKQPLTGERSLAVDASLIPLGLPAYYETSLPTGEGRPAVPASRFAFCQDTGGAILGPGRVDIFLGAGERAKGAAGRVMNPGRLYVLLAKPSRPGLTAQPGVGPKSPRP